MTCCREMMVKKSRKGHRCDWCGEEIPIGDSYHQAVFIDSDGFSHIKFHVECHDAWGKAPLYLVVDGWQLGCFERGSDHERGCGCELHPGNEVQP